MTQVYLVLEAGEDSEAFASREAAVRHYHDILTSGEVQPTPEDEASLDKFREGRIDLATVGYCYDGSQVVLEACTVKR